MLIIKELRQEKNKSPKCWLSSSCSQFKQIDSSQSTEVSTGPLRESSQRCLQIFGITVLPVTSWRCRFIFCFACVAFLRYVAEPMAVGCRSSVQADIEGHQTSFFSSPGAISGLPWPSSHDRLGPQELFAALFPVPGKAKEVQAVISFCSVTKWQHMYNSSWSYSIQSFWFGTYSVNT